MSLETELREVLALSEKATPGPWYWSANGNIVSQTSINGDDPKIAAVYTERDDDGEPSNASFILSSIHFLRQHGSALQQALEDTERLDWIDRCCVCITPDGRKVKSPLLVLGTSRENIDAAIAAEKGEGNEP